MLINYVWVKFRYQVSLVTLANDIFWKLIFHHHLQGGGGTTHEFFFADLDIFKVVYAHPSKTFFETFIPHMKAIPFMIFLCGSEYFIQFLARLFFEFSLGVGVGNIAFVQMYTFDAIHSKCFFVFDPTPPSGLCKTPYV